MQKKKQKKKDTTIDIENHPTCPECGSSDTELEYVNCLCCRTYEGRGTTCWTAPHCNSCGYTGAGNSNGGKWYKPKGW